MLDEMLVVEMLAILLAIFEVVYLCRIYLAFLVVEILILDFSKETKREKQEEIWIILREVYEWIMV
jgi:hypothetical protein